MRHRIEIWYTIKAVVPLQSWQFSWKLMFNLRFCGILNFLKNVRSNSNFREIWAIVLKLHLNIIYQSRIFGTEFYNNRLKCSNFLRFFIFQKFALTCLTCANFELSSLNFVRKCTNTELCFIRNLARIDWSLLDDWRIRIFSFFYLDIKF